jgi:hypothetical protein
MASNFSDIFRDFNFTDSVKKIDSNKAVDIVEFPTVHKFDSEPITIIWPDIKNGPWIAGGACLRWYQGQPVGNSDIDVFCKSNVQAQQLIDAIKSYGRFTVKYESENAVTLQYHKKGDYLTSWTIQIITRRYFNSIEEVINSFDITVCEIGTAGNHWVFGPTTARDIREKNLRFKLPLQPDAPKRLTKYWTYGYRPVEGTIEAIQQNPSTRWSFALDEDYQNAF